MRLLLWRLRDWLRVKVIHWLFDGRTPFVEMTRPEDKYRWYRPIILCDYPVIPERDKP